MRVTWRGLELPTRVERDTSISSEKYGRFFIEPFERGSAQLLVTACGAYYFPLWKVVR